MKILITTDLYKPSVNGVVTSVLNLKSELTKMGHEVRILTLNQNNSDIQDKDVYYVKSISVAKIYPSARVIIGLGNAVVKEIINWHPDIIHSQCEFSTYILARRIAKKLSIPIIHTYHTVYEDYTHYFSPSYTMGKKAVKIFSKAVLNHTKAVIAPTEKVKELLEGYGVKKPIYVIPTGIDLDTVQNKINNEEINKSRKMYGINEEDKVLIYLGRLAKEKNIKELIMYFNKLHKDNLKMLIVGDGPLKDELKDYTKELNLEDKIIYTGQVNNKDISKYYQMADIFVSASTSETQGLTYIEALANKLPLLCRKDKCLEGLVYNNVNGYAYTTFNEFKNYINNYFEKSEIKNKSMEVSSKVASKFSKQAFAKNIFKIYEEAVKKKIA